MLFPGRFAIRGEPFLLHNVDVLSTIDLRRMVEFHRENQALATLAVQDRKTSRYLLFDEHFNLRPEIRARWQDGAGLLLRAWPMRWDSAESM